MKIKVRFPNEDTHHEIDAQNISFVRQKIIGNTVFGYCNSQYVSISLDDYKKLQKNGQTNDYN